MAAIRASGRPIRLAVVFVSEGEIKCIIDGLHGDTWYNSPFGPGRAVRHHVAVSAGVWGSASQHVSAEILVLAGSIILPAPAAPASTGISARLKRVPEHTSRVKMPGLLKMKVSCRCAAGVRADRQRAKPPPRGAPLGCTHMLTTCF